jgi:hypothetical protein
MSNQEGFRQLPYAGGELTRNTLMTLQQELRILGRALERFLLGKRWPWYCDDCGDGCVMLLEAALGICKYH